MGKWRYYILFCVLGLLWVVKAAPLCAQTCSCAGTPLTNNLGVGMVAEEGWLFQLSYDYHRIHDFVAGSELLEKGINRRTTQAALLQASRPIGERFQLSVLASWVRQTFTTNSRLAATGLGDMVVLGQYRLLQKGTTNAYVGLGVKLPTGSTSQTEDGQQLNPDLQPGTGGWDGLLSLLLIKDRIIADRLNFQLSATYRKTTEAQRFLGAQSYQFGDEMLVQAAISDQWVLGTQVVSPFLLLRYRQTAHDLINSQRAFNTGGQWINVGGGLNWQPKAEWGLQLTAMLPAYRHVDGVQLTSSYRINLALNLMLGKQKKPKESQGPIPIS